MSVDMTVTTRCKVLTMKVSMTVGTLWHICMYIVTERTIPLILKDRMLASRFS